MIYIKDAGEYMLMKLMKRGGVGDDGGEGGGTEKESKGETGWTVRGGGRGVRVRGRASWETGRVVTPWSFGGKWKGLEVIGGGSK
jgi:hypothetical protein